MEDFIEQMTHWNKFDASSNVTERVSGVSKSTIEKEVKLWEQQLGFLTPLNYKSIRDDIDTWDISVPDSLTFENIASAYARLVSYKLNISIYWSDARSWRETCETACKFLEELAPGAFTGTGPDKKANAMNVIQPFVHLRVEASRLENYLDKMHSSIVFCAAQLDLMIKERQSRAKFNHRLAHEGEVGLIANSNQDFNSQNEAEEIDEEGYRILTKNPNRRKK